MKFNFTDYEVLLIVAATKGYQDRHLDNGFTWRSTLSFIEIQLRARLVAIIDPYKLEDTVRQAMAAAERMSRTEVSESYE